MKNESKDGRAFVEVDESLRDRLKILVTRLRLPSMKHVVNELIEKFVENAEKKFN